MHLIRTTKAIHHQSRNHYPISVSDSLRPLLLKGNSILLQKRFFTVSPLILGDSVQILLKMPNILLASSPTTIMAFIHHESSRSTQEIHHRSR